MLAGTILAQHSTFVSAHGEAFGRFGWSISIAGDINADGAPDVLVGAFGEDTYGLEDSGRAYLFSSTDGSVIRIFTSPNIKEAGQFGWKVSPAGDLNGDGTPDVFIGASGEGADGVPGSGRVYLFSGLDGSVLRTFTSANPTENGQFGRSIATVRDIDGDDIPDVLIGAPEEDIKRGEARGRVYLFSGSDRSVIHLFASPHSKEGGNLAERLDLQATSMVTVHRISWSGPMQRMQIAFQAAVGSTFSVA